jgi:trimethylamine--corrinoid protein Co-methyltransferase
MNAGMFASCLTVSYEQLVVDSEILGWLFHLRKGIEVTQETLAIEQIKQAGPDGHFLRGDLRFATKRLKTDYWTPAISCRLAYDKWVKGGAKDVTRIARERADQILQEHKPVELDAHIQKDLDRIVENFKETAT